MTHKPGCLCALCYLNRVNGWSHEPLLRALARERGAAVHEHPIMQDAHDGWHDAFTTQTSVKIYVEKHGVYASEPFLYDGHAKTFLGVRA